VVNDAVLITGAGQRIGFFLANYFIKKGKAVFFTYKTNRPKVAELIKKGAVGFKVDFTDEAQINTFLSQIKKQVNSIELLIHNASIWVKDDDLNAELYQEMIAVHQFAPYQITNELVEQLNASSILANVIAISDAKIKNGHHDCAAYLGTKSALKTMMDSFAKKYAPKIKVNTIAPGLIIFNENDSEAYKKQRLQEMAIPIVPTEQVILDAINFLINSPNSTGSTIEIGQLSSNCPPPGIF